MLVCGAVGRNGAFGLSFVVGGGAALWRNFDTNGRAAFGGLHQKLPVQSVF
jgi:hypothetical protein